MADRTADLDLIYRTEHSDFKGCIDGNRTLLVNERGAAVLKFLDSLTSDEIAERLPYAKRKAADMLRPR